MGNEEQEEECEMRTPVFVRDVNSLVEERCAQICDEERGNGREFCKFCWSFWTFI